MCHTSTIILALLFMLHSECTIKSVSGSESENKTSQCSGQLSIAHGILSSKGADEDTANNERHFTCDDGYVVVGSDIVKCGNDSKWIVSGFCGGDFCGDLPVINGGQISDGPQKVGTVRNFSCNVGFSIIGSNVIHCDETKHWVISGHCAKDCTEGFYIENGFLSNGGSSVGASRRITCYRGYKLLGSDLVVCDGDSAWCITGRCELKCTRAAKLENGQILMTGDGIVNNATTRALCNSGYYSGVGGYNGSIQVQCVEDGTWYFDASCKKAVYMPELTEASRNGDVDRIKSLLLSGADINAEDFEGFTALFAATYPGHHIDAMKLLLDHGADVNANTKYNQSLLNLALYLMAYDKGAMEAVNLLLAHGVDVNAHGGDGYTGLICAALLGHTDYVKLFADRGADINAKEHYLGYTALMSATVYNHSDIIEILLHHGANVNLGSHSGVTPLMCAVVYGKADLVQHFIKHGADVNARAADGSTAIDLATAAGNSHIVQLLSTAETTTQQVPSSTSITNPPL